MLTAKAPPAGPMTLEASLDWLDETTRAEWVQGEVVVISPAGVEHNRVVGFLLRLLAAWVEFRQTGVVLAETLLRLPNGNLRVPDLMVLPGSRAQALQGRYVEGPADLVVEVVSPESVRWDYGEKVQEYEQAGVQEYWVVDPGNRVVVVWVLEEGRYRVAFEGQQGRVVSRVLPGFWLEAGWLWERPLPAAHRLMRVIGGEADTRWWTEGQG